MTDKTICRPQDAVLVATEGGYISQNCTMNVVTDQTTDANNVDKSLTPVNAMHGHLLCVGRTNPKKTELLLYIVYCYYIYYTSKK